MSMSQPDSRDRRQRRLPRFASRRPVPPGWTVARVLEILHKVLTAGAALTAIVKFLF